MIFFVILGVCVLSWIVFKLVDKFVFDAESSLSFVMSLIISVSCTIGVIAMLCCMTASRLTKDIDTQSLMQQEQSLRWQAESGQYKYDDIARKLLADKVTEWNVELARYKASKENKWISIFYPIDYDQFDYIPIELLEGHEE